MRRISAIRSTREIELERQREELRDSRWARRRSQLITAGTVAAMAGLAVSGTPAELLRLARVLAGV